MASSKIISGNEIKNNTGTVTYGGNVGSLMNSADYNELCIDELPPGVNTSLGCSKILTNGVLAGMVSTRFVGIGYDVKLANYSDLTDIIGSRVNGEGTSILASATGQYQSVYTDWSYVSGVPTTVTTSVVNFAYDKATVPTRSVPGRLVTLQTGSTPELDNYSSKNT